MSTVHRYYPPPSSHHSHESHHSHRSHSRSRASPGLRGPVYFSSSSSHHGASRYHAGSSYGGSSYVYPDRERVASITTLHRPPLPHSRSLASLVGEPSIIVIPPSRRSRPSLGYEPQYTEDGRLRISTIVRRLFGLGPKPVADVQVGSNKFWPSLGRSRSRPSYVCPVPSREARRPVERVYRSH